jgi:TATA-binding protein-associated factor
VLEDERQAARHADAIAQSGSKDLHDLQHAPKLQALRDILEECGIGMPVAAETPVGAEGGQHRVLVFAQLKVVVLLHLGALPDYNWKHRDFSHAEVE